MTRNIVFAIVGALPGAAILGAVVFFGGFLIANLIEESAPALSMVVPLFGVPLALVVSALFGGYKGWRRGA